MPKENSSREFDVAVFGATGYVGHRLLTELDKLSKKLGWRLLATLRSPQKIQTLKNDFPGAHFEVLDVLDLKAVENVVQKTRLVVNCVGPFDLYGENVVKACAELSTHYLDITGEIIFARRMIERYDKIAKENRATIVSFSGFDSVPSDMGVFLVAQEMHEAFSQQVASVDLIFKVKGGLNGGTAFTALDSSSKIHIKDQKNLNFLSPEKPDLSYGEQDRPRYVPALKKWVAPFFMESINNKVVYRSVALSPDAEKYFSRDFKYRESVFVWGGKWGAAAMALSLRASQSLLETSQGRRFAQMVLPKPGQGPSEKQMQEGFFEATVIATGTRGQTLVRKMACAGDPANISTVKILISCIRVIVAKDFQSKGGVLTPSTAWGAQLLPALRESGISWG